jgi:transposase InsO family protein
VLKKYLQYYNYKRVHGGINYLIPMQVVWSYWLEYGTRYFLGFVSKK